MSAKRPSLLAIVELGGYPNLVPLYQRLVRDMVRPSVERIVIDSRECLVALQEFCGENMPEVTSLAGDAGGNKAFTNMAVDAIDASMRRS